MTGNQILYRVIFAGICLLIVSPSLSGQEEREYIRKGNKLYKKSEFAGSEGMYRRAQAPDSLSGDAGFNLGDALYKQKRFGEASKEFARTVITSTRDSLKQAEEFYNLGNSLIKEQKFDESIQAYINSLKINPDNIQAKYNLAYAQDQLKKQEEQQNQDKKDKDKDKDQDQKNKDKDQKQDKDGQKKKDDQQQQDQQKDQQQDQEQNQQQNQQQPPSISREDAKRLLDALAVREKETKEKVQQDKAAKTRVRVIKNW